MKHELDSISGVVKERLCVSCGACVVACNSEGIEWRYDERHALFAPRVLVPGGPVDRGDAFRVCPGKGVETMRIAETTRSPEAKYDVELGYILHQYAARTNEERLLKNAASGGVITGLAHFLLSTGKVAGVLTTRFAYGAGGPKPEALIARDIDTLIQGQGSKYCPVSIHEALLGLKGNNEKIAFIGTPCQVAALRMMMERFDWLRDSIYCVIGSFCGGMKDFRALNTIIRRQGIDPSEVVQFCFRGGGQPGRMSIEDARGRVKTRPYPDYGTDTGFKKLERCRLCSDGTAELADIACGDAWVPRFLNSGQPWSIAIARNETGSELLREMIDTGRITIEAISADEIKHSQRANLASKKKRQMARRRLYRLLGRSVPAYDGGIPETTTSLWLELKVHLRHAALRTLETLRVYRPLIKCARWIRGTNEYRRGGSKPEL